MPAVTIPHGGVRSGRRRGRVSSPPGAKELAWMCAEHGEAPNRVARAGGALVRGGDGRNDGLVGGWWRPNSVEDELEPARDESQNWMVRELSGVVLKLGKEMARPEVVCTNTATGGRSRRSSWPRRG